MSPDIAASVHRRLLNRAREEGRPFMEVLQYYTLQRFLYRLGASRHCERFVLKGALMLVAWQSPVTRPTRDIDLLGRMANSVEEAAEAIREVAAVPVPEDALQFDPGSVVGERITEGAGYAGVRVRFVGYLGKARIPMQIDVGFGDALVPGPTPVRLPSTLDLAPAVLQGYTRESVIAEKLQVMLALGEINSRMRTTMTSGCSPRSMPLRVLRSPRPSRRRSAGATLGSSCRRQACRRPLQTPTTKDSGAPSSGATSWIGPRRSGRRSRWWPPSCSRCSWR